MRVLQSIEGCLISHLLLLFFIKEGVTQITVWVYLISSGRSIICVSEVLLLFLRSEEGKPVDAESVIPLLFVLRGNEFQVFPIDFLPDCNGSGVVDGNLKLFDLTLKYLLVEFGEQRADDIEVLGLVSQLVLILSHHCLNHYCQQKFVHY